MSSTCLEWADIYATLREHPTTTRFQDPDAGNVGFARWPKSIVSKTAIFCQSKRGEKAKAAHQFLFINEHEVLNASFSLCRASIRILPASEYIRSLNNSGAEYCVLGSAEPPCMDIIQKIEERAKMQLTWRYSPFEVGLQALDLARMKLLGSRGEGWDEVVFRKLGDLWKRGVICSKSGNWILVHLGWVDDFMAYAYPNQTYLYLRNKWEVKLQTGGW